MSDSQADPVPKPPKTDRQWLESCLGAMKASMGHPLALVSQPTDWRTFIAQLEQHLAK